MSDQFPSAVHIDPPDKLVMKFDAKCYGRTVTVTIMQKIMRCRFIDGTFEDVPCVRNIQDSDGEDLYFIDGLLVDRHQRQYEPIDPTVIPKLCAI